MILDQVARNDVPDDVVIYRGVAMHKAIAHSDDLTPGNLCCGLLCCRGDLAGSLTDDFDKPLKGGRQNQVGVEICSFS